MRGARRSVSLQKRVIWKKASSREPRFIHCLLSVLRKRIVALVGVLREVSFAETRLLFLAPTIHLLLQALLSLCRQGGICHIYANRIVSPTVYRFIVVAPEPVGIKTFRDREMLL